MQPEIEAYLRDHGARYTTKALRLQLLHAGYDPSEVDAALQETEAARAPRFAETRMVRRRFWLWVIGLNVVGWVVGTVFAFLVPSRTGVGSTNLFYAPAVPIVLGFFLLIGLGISGRIGRYLLGRGMGMALLVPLVVAVALTGTCMALAGLPPAGR